MPYNVATDGLLKFLTYQRDAMTKNKSLFSLSVFLLLLSACAPVPTQETPTPTLAPTATNTPLPTETPTPTATLTPTPEPYLKFHKDSFQGVYGWLLFDGENLAGRLFTKNNQEVLEIVVNEKTYEVDYLVEHKTGVAVADLGEKTESGYELGAVWREGEWREIMLDYEPGTDGYDFDNMPVIGYEDFTSGRLTETEKLIAEPFSDEIEVVRIYKPVTGGAEFVAGFIQEKIDYYSENPDEYPSQPRFFSKVEINGVETVMITWQIKDKSGSDKFLHMVEVLDGLLDEESFFFQAYSAMISLRRPPAFNLFHYSDCEGLSWVVPILDVVCPINRPKADDLDELIEQLLESGSIPEELETELFASSTVTWGMIIIPE